MIFKFLFILAFCTASLGSASAQGSCKLDLAFVLDKSASIENENYGGKAGNFREVILDFVKNVASEYGVTPKGMHAAVVLFSQRTDGENKAILQFPFLSSRKKFDEDINKIETRDVNTFGTTTRIDEGLEVARKKLFEASNSGVRKDANKYIVLITDGQQRSGHVNALWEQTKKIRALKVAIVAIGIGSHVNSQQLQKMAGEHGQFLKADKFELLKDQLKFIKNLCKEHCSDKLEKADIGFVVDSKADNNFGKRLEIVKKIAEGYKIGKNRNHRAALISFGDEVKTKSGLTANGETFSDALYNVRQSATNSPRVDLAMRRALEDLFGANYGERPATQKVLFVLFDGKKNGNVNVGNLKTYVEALKNKYVIIIAIVMGDGGPVPLVKDLADEADTVHVEHTVTPQLAAEMAETKSCRKQFPKPCVPQE